MQNLGFETVIGGSTLGQWMWAAVFVLGGFTLARLVYALITKVVKRITSHLHLTLIDTLIEAFRKPFVLAIIMLGIFVGLNRLELSDAAAEWLKRIYTAAVTLNMTWFVTRTIGALLDNYVSPHVWAKSVNSQLFPLLRKFLSYIMWGIGLVLGLSNAGYDVSAMLAGLGIGGMALALAAQDTVSNFFGGFTIFTDHPFNVGDRIRIAGHDGFVKEVGMRCFRLRTLAGTEVIIPNSQATNSVIENVSCEPARKITLDLGLTYDTKPDRMRRAIEILCDIAEAHPLVHHRDGPAAHVPSAQFTAYGDFSLGILFIYYIKAGSNYYTVQSDINLAILERFNAEGLEFAFPTQTLYTVPATASAADTPPNAEPKEEVIAAQTAS